MKKSLAVLVGAVIMVTGLAVYADDPETDVLLTVHCYMPKDNQSWNRASGIEVQARFWNEGNIGAAVSIGADSWVANSEYVVENSEDGNYSSSVYGNTVVVPVGISALFRGEINSRTAMILEAGFRYGLTDSRINAETTFEDAEQSLYYVDRVETDNLVLGVAGLSLQTLLFEELWLNIGFRYQFDMLDTHEWYLGEDMGTVSFQTASFDLGVSWKF